MSVLRAAPLAILLILLRAPHPTAAAAEPNSAICAAPAGASPGDAAEEEGDAVAALHTAAALRNRPPQPRAGAAPPEQLEPAREVKVSWIQAELAAGQAANATRTETQSWLDWRLTRFRDQGRMHILPMARPDQSGATWWWSAVLACLLLRGLRASLAPAGASAPEDGAAAAAGRSWWPRMPSWDAPWEVFTGPAAKLLDPPGLPLPAATEAAEGESVVRASSDAVPAGFSSDWGQGPSTPGIPTSPLHVLMMREQATNDAPALWVGEDPDPVSYRELLGAAHRLSRQLVTDLAPNATVEKPNIVPLLMLTSSGFEVVAGLLAALMAGAAFAPIDVAVHPPLRLQTMLEQVGARVALASRPATARLDAVQHLPRIVVIDRKELSKSFQQDEVLSCVSEDMDAPMALYWTSGSTGRPKGVLITCRAAMTHYVYYPKQFGWGPGTNVLRTTGITFDVTYSVVLGALLHGATVVWPTSEVLLKPNALVTTCREHNVSFLVLVPTVLSVLLEHETFPSCVRDVGCAGEALHWALVERFLARAGAPALHNRYGPSECANILTLKQNVALVNTTKSATVPVGRPCAHRELHLVPLPDHAPDSGEVWVTGPALATGYLGQPELTAASFRGLPSGAQGPPGRQGSPAYKTGDVARWSDGELVFLGRADLQVKLRGNRVELGEIEAVLKMTPGVSEAVVVVANADRPGSMALVAFLSPSTADLVAASQKASELLPAHMVPEAIHVVDTWPRGSTGKIDRAALRAQAAAGSDGKGGGAVGVYRDSFGELRVRVQQHAREKLVLNVVRLLLVVQVIQAHLFWPWGIWKALEDMPVFNQVPVAGLTKLLVAPVFGIQHTTMLLFVVGYQDALDVEPTALNRRDLAIFVLNVVRYAVPWIGDQNTWWLPHFLWVRVLAAFGRFRYLAYALWLTVTLLYPPGHKPIDFFEYRCTPFLFAAMYWLGLELGPSVRRLAAHFEYGSACSQRWLLFAAGLCGYCACGAIGYTPGLHAQIDNSPHWSQGSFWAIPETALNLCSLAFLAAVAAAVSRDGLQVEPRVLLWAILVSDRKFYLLEFGPWFHVDTLTSWLQAAQLGDIRAASAAVALMWVLPASYVVFLGTVTSTVTEVVWAIAASASAAASRAKR